jgi:hypothetical protein
MQLGMPSNRCLFFVGLLALTSACGSQTMDDSQTTDQLAIALAPTTTDAAEADATWLSVVRNADPVLAAQVPSAVAIGPSWNFAEIVQGEAEPSEFDAACGRQTPEQPGWLLVRFLVNSVAAGEPYREGTLDIRLYRGAPAVLDDYMAYQQVATCLEDSLPSDVTMTNISEALPAGVVKAFRVDYAHSSGEPEAEFTVVYAHRQDAAVQVLVSAMQPDGHPNALDTTEEALRVTGEIRKVLD